MSCTKLEVFILLSTAWTCFTNTYLGVLASEREGQDRTMQAIKRSLSYPFVKSNNRHSQSVYDGSKVIQMEQRSSAIRGHKNKQSVTTKQGFIETHVTGSTIHSAVEKISKYVQSPNTSTSTGFLNSRTSKDYTVDVQNRPFSDIKDHNFDDLNEEQNTIMKFSRIKLGISKSRREIFPCIPCYCSLLDTGFVIANCTDKHLNTIPPELPYNMTVLNMSLNSIHVLNFTSLLSYPYLLNVSVTSNRNLTEIQTSQENQTSSLKLINLSQCAIRNIQGNSFVIVPYLTDLIMNKNKLQKLTQFMFTGLENLRDLDLSENYIQNIEQGTFYFLKNLKALDLSRNNLIINSITHFSPQLFINLTQLQKLSIHSNQHIKERVYPDQALKNLMELQYLSIDGLGEMFGPEMKSLTHLVTLEILGNCQFKSINPTFFENLPYLKSFRLNKCLFEYIYPEAYKALGSLRHLTLSNLKNYDLDSAFKDLTGFNNSKLKTITFNHLRRPNHQCKFLSSNHSKYIKNFEIELLDLSDNKIALLGNDFVENLPKSLKTLILSGNKLTSGTLSIKVFSIMGNITTLDLSMQNIDNYFRNDNSFVNDKSECSNGHSSCIIEDTSLNEDTDNYDGLTYDNSENLRSALSSDNLTIQNILTSADRHGLNKRWIIDIPPNLQILQASQYYVFGMQILTHILFPKNNSLSVIDFSTSFMSMSGRAALPEKITYADLSHNYCTKIGRGFFQPKNSHQHIVLNNNFLGPDFANDDKGIIFGQLKKTKYLYISNNLIYKLPKLIFKGMYDLRHLDLSDNKLSTLNASFTHMNKLEFIDLRSNAIRWIDTETRGGLDYIAAQKGHVLTIDLTMNPLPCTCAGLEIITWMAATKVHFHNEDLLTCTTDNMKSDSVGDLERRRQLLQRLCMSKALFIIGSVAAIIVVMVTAGFGLMYRYRWKLRYLHNTTMAALFGFKPEVVPKSGCTFDAYFVYTDETRDFVLETCLKELEVKRGHRLCVEDRDFLAGTYIVSNIVSAVRNSTKTVPVITPEFFSEPYSEYSFKMAIMEEQYKHRSVLHLFLYKPVPHDQMSHDELKVMKQNSYTEFPPEEEKDENIRKTFWDSLSDAIGHTDNSKCEAVLEIPE